MLSRIQAEIRWVRHLVSQGYGYREVAQFLGIRSSRVGEICGPRKAGRPRRIYNLVDAPLVPRDYTPVGADRVHARSELREYLLQDRELFLTETFDKPQIIVGRQSRNPLRSAIERRRIKRACDLELERWVHMAKYFGKRAAQRNSNLLPSGGRDGNRDRQQGISERELRA